MLVSRTPTATWWSRSRLSTVPMLQQRRLPALVQRRPAQAQQRQRPCLMAVAQRTRRRQAPRRQHSCHSCARQSQRRRARCQQRRFWALAMPRLHRRVLATPLVHSSATVQAPSQCKSMQMLTPSRAKRQLTRQLLACRCNSEAAVRKLSCCNEESCTFKVATDVLHSAKAPRLMLVPELFDGHENDAVPMTPFIASHDW